MRDYFLILFICSQFLCLEHIFLKEKKKILKSSSPDCNSYLYLEFDWIFQSVCNGTFYSNSMLAIKDVLFYNKYICSEILKQGFGGAA